jgi:hypothetical protein
MSSKSKTEVVCKALAVAIPVVLGGCSDIYFDRRETVALGADDHIAVNRVAQMVDPWPHNVANKNIAFSGDRIQPAVERYRRHEIIRPVSPITSSMTQQQIPLTTEAVTSPVQNNTSTPAAPVK